MLSLESQRIFQNLLCLTNHLMTGPLVNSEFCFPRISKIHCSPRDQSLSVKYCIVLYNVRPLRVGHQQMVAAVRSLDIYDNVKRALINIKSASFQS